MRRLLAGVVALLLAATYVTSAFAQSGSSVRQSGTITPNTVPYWITSGVIGDGVNAADSPITSFGVTNAGGNGLCVSSDRLTAAGRNQLCMGASTTGPGFISLQNYGTASVQNLQFIINGTPVTIPTSGSAFVMASGALVDGDLPCWLGTTGLLKDCGGGIPTNPVVHPSSGNIFGTGCLTAQAHSAWWVDQNLCSTADTWKITSNDPSASFTLTLSGSVTTGDAISLTITMGSGNCSGAGCTVTTGAATGGDTLTTLAGKLACAVANNTSLFRINGGTCTGGVISPAAGASFGGYASGNPIGFTVINGVGIAFDFNSNISMKVTSSVSGAATEVVTINNTGCGSACSFPLDNNPALQMVRNSGAAPQPGSVLGAIYSIGATSGCPTTTCVNYGSIANWVANSTAGSIQSAWLLQTPNTSGTAAGGMWFGQGAYSNFSGSPFSSTALQDKGIGTLNLGSCLWFNSTPTRDATSTDKLCQDPIAGQLELQATGVDSVILASSAGVGINVTPTGAAFVSGLGFFAGGTQVPTTGSGISLQGGATPVMQSYNFGTTTYLAQAFTGLSWDFKPSASATTGFSISANTLAPDVNNASSIGTASLAPLNVYSYNLLLKGSSSGTATITPPAAAGTPTLTLPARNGTFALNAAPTVQTFTSGSGTYTTPANVTWIEIEEVGGGGGGAGSGTSPVAAGAGGNTCWNTSGAACSTPVYQAGGGALGVTNGGATVGAAGGTVSGSGSCTDSQPGGNGGPSPNLANSFGGLGGMSRYAGGGQPGWGGANIAAAGATNSGGGGGGSGENATANGGGGGGAGAWCYVILIAPAATYTYAVGTGGSAGTAGTGGNNGAAGAAGKIRVIEHYN